MAAILAVYAMLAWTAALSKGLSFDEGMQLAVGYHIWLDHDHRLEGGNGDLIKRWATLPFLLSQPNRAVTDAEWWRRPESYDFGWRFFFQSGNNPEALLRQSRLMVALLGVATGLLVFYCGREAFGTAGGFISLGLFALSPTMLAFGGVVSTDMSITLTLFGATWCIWRLLHEVTVGRVLGSLAFTSAAVLAKPTAVVLFPIAGVLVAVKLLRGNDVMLRWRNWVGRVSPRRGQVMLFGALALLHVVAAWALLWAHYDFRYAAAPQPGSPPMASLAALTAARLPVPIAASFAFAREHHVLPEAFLRGIEGLMLWQDGLGSYMDGQWSLEGWASFFPYAIWVKTPPALFLMLALTVAALAWHRGRWTRAPAPAKGGSETGTDLYALTPYLTLVACYLAVAITDDMNLGHRHVLPIYPALYVLGGGAALWCARRRWAWAIVGLGLTWQAQESFAIRPDYLAYFGPQAGGPEDGYKRLVDSSVDWGMDLPALRQWLDEHNPAGKEPLFLAYFGTDRPAYYGIKAHRLPGFLERRTQGGPALTPGYYAISASLLQGVYTAAFGRWNLEYERMYRQTLQNIQTFAASAGHARRRAELLKQRDMHEWQAEYDLFENLRFARLCAWLRNRGEPEHTVGHSILIWHLNEAELTEALLGPAAEFADTPAVLRSFRHTVAPKREQPHRASTSLTGGFTASRSR